VKADAKSRAAVEVAEYAIQRFGTGVAREGVQALATKIEVAAARHGGEVLQAVRKVGPRALLMVEEAGIHSKQAVRMLAQHGEAGAAWVVARPTAMRLVAQHGEGAAAALVKHAGGVAEPMIGQFGAPAIRALEKTGPQGGRRLAILMADGHLDKIGRTPELLEVIAKHGEAACTFVWKNKEALAVGATLTAFIASPESFLGGTAKITQAAGEHVIAPVVAPITQGIATAFNLALVGVFVLVGGGVVLAFRHGILRPEEIRAWWAQNRHPNKEKTQDDVSHSPVQDQLPQGADSAKKGSPSEHL